MKHPTPPAIRFLFILFGSSCLTVLPAWSDPVDQIPASNNWESASVEVLTEAVNTVAIEISNQVKQAAEIRTLVETAWNNPAITSDAIEARRLALKQAEAAMIQARIDLDQAVGEHPDVQGWVKANTEKTTQIAELRKKNVAIMKALRARRLKPETDQ